MGSIRTTASAADDSQQFTLSTWVKYLDSVDVSSDLSMLCQFGNTNTRGCGSVIGVNPNDSSIKVILVGSRFLFLGANVGGASFTDNDGDADYSKNFTGFAFDHKPSDTITVGGKTTLWLSDWAPNTGPGASLSPALGASTPGWRLPYLSFHTTASAFLPNVWNHIFIAANVSNGFVNRSTWSPGTRQVDNPTTFFTGIPDVPYSPPVEPTKLYCPAYIYVNGASACVYESGHDGEILGKADRGGGGEAANGPFADTASVSFGSNNPPSRNGALVNGYPISLPGTYPKVIHDSIDFFDDAGTERKVFAATQVWFNTFIDPSNSDNLAKFIRVSDGKLIAPVRYNKSGTVTGFGPAVSAFGMPNLLFDGNHSQFPNNRNTEGDTFSLAATGTDYTPYPSSTG